MTMSLFLGLYYEDLISDDCMLVIRLNLFMVLRADILFSESEDLTYDLSSLSHSTA